MYWLIAYIVIVILNHLVMARVCRVIGPPPDRERPLIVFCMFVPIFNTVTLLISIVVLLFGYEEAPFIRFYNFIFNESK